MKMCIMKIFPMEMKCQCENVHDENGSKIMHKTRALYANFYNMNVTNFYSMNVCSARMTK